jgi:hypothetical protein
MQAIKFTSKAKLAFGLTLGIILISLMSFRTIARNSDWSDEFTIAMRDLDVDNNGIIAQEGWLHQAK